MEPTELVVRNACPKEVKTMLDYRYSLGWQLQQIIDTKQNLLIYLFKKIK